MPGGLPSLTEEKSRPGQCIAHGGPQSALARWRNNIHEPSVESTARGPMTEIVVP